MQRAGLVNVAATASTSFTVSRFLLRRKHCGGFIVMHVQAALAFILGGVIAVVMGLFLLLHVGFMYYGCTTLEAMERRPRLRNGRVNTVMLGDALLEPSHCLCVTMGRNGVTSSISPPLTTFLRCLDRARCTGCFLSSVSHTLLWARMACRSGVISIIRTNPTLSSLAAADVISNKGHVQHL